jgi:arylsulfatase A-like enzyme
MGILARPPEDSVELPELRANHAWSEDDPPVLEKVKNHPVMKSVHPTADYTESNWHRYMWAYHRLVEKVDTQIGDLLEDLDRRGLTDNTVIVFTSDHGEGYGSHHWNQKQCFYEEVARVPFLVSGPGIPGRGTIDRTHLVSIGLDILPTLLDFAGAEIPSTLPGRSVKPLLLNPEGDWRETCVLQTEFGAWGPDNQTGVKGRCVLSRNYKYVRYVDPDDPDQPKNEQLFHLASDPGERRNLALDSKHQDELNHHRHLLIEYAEATSDPFPTHV